MKQASSCNCRGGCANKRCACFKQGKACGDCQCAVACANPFNDASIKGMIDSLTDCAYANIAQLKPLLAKEHGHLHPLPCGCEQVALEALMSDYTCAECK